MTKPPAPVQKIFASYPEPVKERLLELRAIIFDVAAVTDGVGMLEETLKWGEPSYLTSQTKSGSTIRLAPFKKTNTHVAIYFNCKTNLLDRFRQHYPKTFLFEGNRALVFDLASQLPKNALEHCIALALTYHLSK